MSMNMNMKNTNPLITFPIYDDSTCVLVKLIVQCLICSYDFQKRIIRIYNLSLMVSLCT